MTVENREKKKETNSLYSSISKQALANLHNIYNNKPASNYLLTVSTYLLKEGLISASDYLLIVEDQYNILSEIEDTIKNKKERKATTLLFLLENDLIYYNLLGKLYPFPPTNQRSLHFLLQQLEKKGLIRAVPKNEMINEKRIFRSVVIKSSPAGDFQADTIKFYTLTDLARAIIPSFHGSLSEISTHLGDIKLYKRIIRETHKERQEKAEREKRKKEEAARKEQRNQELIEGIYEPYKDVVLSLRATDIHDPGKLKEAVKKLREQGCKARMDTLKTIWKHWHQQAFYNRRG